MHKKGKADTHVLEMMRLVHHDLTILELERIRDPRISKRDNLTTDTQGHGAGPSLAQMSAEAAIQLSEMLDAAFFFFFGKKSDRSKPRPAQ